MHSIMCLHAQCSQTSVPYNSCSPHAPLGQSTITNCVTKSSKMKPIIPITPKQYAPQQPQRETRAVSPYRMPMQAQHWQRCRAN